MYILDHVYRPNDHSETTASYDKGENDTLTKYT